jgi:hypothetical protein
MFRQRALLDLLRHAPQYAGLLSSNYTANSHDET